VWTKNEREWLDDERGRVTTDNRFDPAQRELPLHGGWMDILTGISAKKLSVTVKIEKDRWGFRAKSS
jgi:hypothetical protein